MAYRHVCLTAWRSHALGFGCRIMAGSNRYSIRDVFFGFVFMRSTAGGTPMMTWRDREREYREQQAELERLACETADREANPELYREMPAVWDDSLYSDLKDDDRRDGGTR